MAEEVKPGEKKLPDPELTQEIIRTLDAKIRESLCVAEINLVLTKYNAIFNPILMMNNHGQHIDVKVIGLAYDAPMPAGLTPSWN